MYKLTLSDSSFYIVDQYFELTLFKHILKKRVSIEEYLSTNNYKDYYLIDQDPITKQKTKRTFKITEPTEEETKLPSGIRIKYSEDIKIGDFVLGANNEPERVINLHSGEEEMFNITVNGETYTVNSSHILELIEKDTGEHLQMQVGVYVNMDDDFKSRYVMEIANF